MDDAMKAMADDEPELTEVQFLRVEAEERPNISMEFQVAAVPTFLFFRNGWVFLFGANSFSLSDVCEFDESEA